MVNETIFYESFSTRFHYFVDGIMANWQFDHKSMMIMCGEHKS